ncbi:MAG: hypothetical protein JWO67_956 [Streptosporangiaceae bacterium]|nr:hypothetical protein [Streptosporangiaceae bacterium]
MSRAVEPYGRMAAQVESMITAAMRADPAALALRAGELASRGELDPHSAGFVREARRLVLCGGAALLSVLEAHRPGTDPYGQEICTGCGTPACRTLRLVAEVLAAYLAGRPYGVDRAEAWRRADAWFAHESGERLLVELHEFEAGYIARAVRCPADVPADGTLVVVDRDGSLTRWPLLPHEDLIHHYRRYRNGELPEGDAGGGSGPGR